MARAEADRHVPYARLLMCHTLNSCPHLSLPLSLPRPPSPSLKTVKNVLGAGVLSLPSGIGAFSKNPLALIPAAALTMGLGSLSAYCFTLIARVCALNKVQTYGYVFPLFLALFY